MAALDADDDADASSASGQRSRPLLPPRQQRSPPPRQRQREAHHVVVSPDDALRRVCVSVMPVLLLLLLQASQHAALKLQLQLHTQTTSTYCSCCCYCCCCFHRWWRCLQSGCSSWRRMGTGSRRRTQRSCCCGCASMHLAQRRRSSLHAAHSACRVRCESLCLCPGLRHTCQPADVFRVGWDQPGSCNQPAPVLSGAPTCCCLPTDSP